MCFIQNQVNSKVQEMGKKTSLSIEKRDQIVIISNGSFHVNGPASQTNISDFRQI